METQYLIIGQGISGTMLSWMLMQQGASCVVINNQHLITPSSIAAGVINPVTGRRYAYTWLIDEIMPFAVQQYRQMETYFNASFVEKKSLIDFFPSPQMLHAFTERAAEDDTYLHAYPDQNRFNPVFNYEFGCGEISPAYLVNFKALLNRWRLELLSKEHLREEEFDIQHLELNNVVKYKDIIAEKIIFCDGTASGSNPYFRPLPFAPNKGESLIIHCEEMPDYHIFKKGMMLVPIQQDQYWVGSNYLWDFEDDQPSEKFLHQAKGLLNQWIKKPFTIIEHKAAIRPATLERRPFVGIHPHHPQIALLNGMGTKGASLAPYFAHQLTGLLLNGTPLHPEADIYRFKRMLGREQY